VSFGERRLGAVQQHYCSVGARFCRLQLTTAASMSAKWAAAIDTLMMGCCSAANAS